MLANAEKNNYKVNHAREVHEKIKIYPETLEDHRKITKLLVTHDQEFYCRSIDDDRLIKAVIKKIPSFISPEEIQRELEEEKYQIVKIGRMTKKATDGEKIPITDKNKQILNLRIINYFQVYVEPKNTNALIQQCH